MTAAERHDCRRHSADRDPDPTTRHGVQQPPNAATSELRGRHIVRSEYGDELIRSELLQHALLLVLLRGGGWLSARGAVRRRDWPASAL